jgi:hypothetical protein
MSDKQAHPSTVEAQLRDDAELGINPTLSRSF